MFAAVTGTESGYGNSPLQLLIPSAFKDTGRFYIHDLNAGCGQKIVDMPAQFLLIEQMTPYPGCKIAPGAAGINIAACGKIAASQRTCHNPDILVQADMQLVGNVVFWKGKV